MTSIRCSYAGDLRCEAVHGPSASELSTDAPTDNQGRGERFSPTDLVATALATCMLTVMGILAERHGWPLHGATARVEKRMSGEGPRRIAALEVWIDLPEDLTAALSEAELAMLRHAAETCPVKRSLEGSVAMTLQWGA
jgi:putative redox protein